MFGLSSAGPDCSPHSFSFITNGVGNYDGKLLLEKSVKIHPELRTIYCEHLVGSKLVDPKFSFCIAGFAISITLQKRPYKHEVVFCRQFFILVTI